MADPGGERRAQGDGGSPTEQEPVMGTVTRTIRVQGITCPDCIATIAASVKRLPETRMVSGNVDRGLVTVAFEPGSVSVQDVIAAIETAGYRVLQIES
jgi:copper chaperone CopZ